MILDPRKGAISVQLERNTIEATRKRKLWEIEYNKSDSEKSSKKYREIGKTLNIYTCYTFNIHVLTYIYTYIYIYIFIYILYIYVCTYIYINNKLCI